MHLPDTGLGTCEGGGSPPCQAAHSFVGHLWMLELLPMLNWNNHPLMFSLALLAPGIARGWGLHPLHHGSCLFIDSFNFTAHRRCLHQTPVESMKFCPLKRSSALAKVQSPVPGPGFSSHLIFPGQLLWETSPLPPTCAPRNRPFLNPTRKFRIDMLLCVCQDFPSSSTLTQAESIPYVWFPNRQAFVLQHGIAASENCTGRPRSGRLLAGHPPLLEVTTSQPRSLWPKQCSAKASGLPSGLNQPMCQYIPCPH